MIHIKHTQNAKCPPPQAAKILSLQSKNADADMQTSVSTFHPIPTQQEKSRCYISGLQLWTQEESINNAHRSPATEFQ